MSRAARSLFAFGIYVVVVGVGFLAMPSTLMSLLQLPAATAGWARVVGLLALVIGCYDIVGARAESLAYLRASVWVRCGFAAGTTILVLLAQMPMTVILLGLTDAAGAAWTALSLRSDAAVRTGARPLTTAGVTSS